MTVQESSHTMSMTHEWCSMNKVYFNRQISSRTTQSLISTPRDYSERIRLHIDSYWAEYENIVIRFYLIIITSFKGITFETLIGRYIYNFIKIILMIFV